MFDVFTIDFSQWSTRFNMGNEGRGSFFVAFGMGSIAALLAGACVAPVVIQVVLFSSSLYAAGTTAALALPFLLGLGMALPWPVAGAGISAMPKPGAWMVHVKHALRRVDPWHVALLRLSRLHLVCRSLGGRVRGGGERRAEAAGRLACIPRRGACRGAAGAEACARRHVGNVGARTA